jgi:hypothetical protein
MTDIARVSAHYDVLALDGEYLGQVTNVASAEFQISPPNGRHFWLAQDLVHRIDDHSVTLSLTKSELCDYKHTASRGLI